MSNNKNTNAEFDEKVVKSAERQKKITRVVCLFLAALMALGGTIGVLAIFIK